MIGGYTIIDLKKINITSSGVKIPGTYERLESSYGKPFLFLRPVINGVELSSFYSLVASSGDSYDIQYFVDNSGNPYFISVSSDDIVTFRRAIVQASDYNEIDGPSASM